jgi:hypothetical protein
MLNYLLGSFIFTVVNIKKKPPIPTAPHTRRARYLSDICSYCFYSLNQDAHYSDKFANAN